MNPFLKHGYACSKGSINRHLVEGVRANEFFSPTQIRNALTNDQRINFDPSKNILKQANRKLIEKTNDATFVKKIIYQFGERLAKVLLLFQDPTEAQKKHRKTYNDSNWEFLKNLPTIYLAGGLLTKGFTPIFKEAVNNYFKIHPYEKEVVWIENSSNLALEGLARLSEDALVYDFGQTHIKVGVVHAHQLHLQPSVDVDVLPNENLHTYALETHQMIFKILSKHLREHPTIHQVHMAISNYVHQGMMDPAPWHYGVLYHLEAHYESYLKEALSKHLKRTIQVTLHHDTTSMGYTITPKGHALLISLGTAFGACYF